jgi:hypothetical protein
MYEAHSIKNSRNLRFYEKLIFYINIINMERGCEEKNKTIKFLIELKYLKYIVIIIINIVIAKRF